MNRSYQPVSSTSLAAVFVEAGKPLEIREYRIPKPLPGEVLVKVECCTLCGSDLHTILGRRKEPAPTILGHETVGVIAALGSDATQDLYSNQLNIGDRIVWSNCVSCGTCKNCNQDLPQKCDSLKKYGHSLADGRFALSGGFAEYVLLRPKTAILKVDKQMSSAAVSPASCATATVMAAYQRLKSVNGKRVLILGSGMLGLTAALYAKSQQAQSITMVDPDEQRRHEAERLVSCQAISFEAFTKQVSSRANDNSCYDIIIEVSGTAQAIQASLQSGDNGAAVALLGAVAPVESVYFDPQVITRKCISVFGVHNYTPVNLCEAINFLNSENNSDLLSQVVSKSFTLSDINVAVEYAISERPLRVAIYP